MNELIYEGDQLQPRFMFENYWLRNSARR